MNFIEIGAVVKPHGLNGQLVLYIEDLYAGVVLGFSSVYLEQFSSKVPYKVEEVSRLSNGRFKADLIGIDTIEAANALRGVKVFQEEDKLPKSQTIDWEGFTVFDAEDKKIGVVVEVIENNMQLIIVLEDGEDEFMIPLVEEFIVGFDEKKKLLHLDLPEGLLDL